MAAAQKGGGEALERNREELSTKVHAVVDGLGNPLRALLTLGNRNDICYEQQLLELFDLRGKYVAHHCGGLCIFEVALFGMKRLQGFGESETLEALESV